MIKLAERQAGLPNPDDRRDLTVTKAMELLGIRSARKRKTSVPGTLSGGHRDRRLYENREVLVDAPGERRLSISDAIKMLAEPKEAPETEAAESPLWRDGGRMVEVWCKAAFRHPRRYPRR